MAVIRFRRVFKRCLKWVDFPPLVGLAGGPAEPSVTRSCLISRASCGPLRLAAAGMFGGMWEIASALLAGCVSLPCDLIRAASSISTKSRPGVRIQAKSCDIHSSILRASARRYQSRSGRVSWHGGERGSQTMQNISGSQSGKIQGEIEVSRLCFRNFGLLDDCQMAVR